MLAICFFAVAPAQNKQSESYALVAGTVFRDPGFAVPGAEVVLAAAPGEPGGVKTPKARKQKSSTDARGEFVFRVPPGPGSYVLSVSAKGLKPQEKTVSVHDTERVDVTLMMQQESK